MSKRSEAAAAADSGETGTSGTAADASDVTGPVPTDPAPTGPAPTGPAPTGPAPTGPAPTGPAPTGPAPTGPAETAEQISLPAVVARLTSSDLDNAERRRLLGQVVGSARVGTRRGLRSLLVGPQAAARWALDTLVDVAPRIPVRDAETLRRHHGGKSGELLADALVRNASRASAAVGAAGGGVAAVEWVAPPTLLTTPVLIAAETVVVVAIEVKLIAELHEVYGLPVTGSPTERGSQLLGAWAQRRGVTLWHPARGVSSVLAVGMRKELRDRLVRRMGRNLTTIGPLLTGAAVAGELNRRATRSLGELVREDLRQRPAGRPALPPGS